MNVWFGTTTAKWNSYKKYYFAINDYLKEKGAIPPFDWLDKADKFYQTDYKERNITKLYAQITEAIDIADIVVIEYTVPNFSSSHQINYSLLRKKPTLVMRLTKDNPRFSDSYIDAVQSEYLTVRDYTWENYKKVLDEFIEYSMVPESGQRYNIVLGKKQKQYLDEMSYKTKKSRSQIIRELIDKANETGRN